MAVPKKHTTKSKRDKKRMHIFLNPPTLGNCPKCGKPKLPHAICHNCGFYKGVEVLDVLSKLEKKEKKKREKEIKEKEREETRKERPLTLEELSKKKF
jgi:large subunit ribosomal protein L32